MNKISIQEVKEALKDQEFRKSLPEILKEDIKKYERNPGCPCNLDVYQNVLTHASKQLKEYYPNKEIDTNLIQQNNFTVINCHIDEIENKLKSLGPGRMQIAIARWEDQATVIINFLDN